MQSVIDSNLDTKKLLQMILGATLIFWFLTQFGIGYELFLSPQTSYFTFLYQAPLSALIPVTESLSVSTLFDLGFSCLVLRFLSSILAQYMGKKRFWTLLIITIYVQALCAVPFLKYPTSLTSPLLLGFTTLFCTLSGGRPMMLLIFPILPKHILIIGLIVWLITPFISGFNAEGFAAIGAFITYYLAAIILFKQNLPFEITANIDYSIRKSYTYLSSFIQWKILPIFRRN